MKRLDLLSEEEFEAICNRCGACCGAYDGDPCEELRRDKDGKYYCRVYKTRLGTHHTIKGLEMECVPIVKKLKETWVGEKKCAYKRLINEGKL